MKEEIKHRILLFFILGFMFIFIMVCILKNDFLDIFLMMTFFVPILLIILFYKKLNLSIFVLWLLSLFLFFHVLISAGCLIMGEEIYHIVFFYGFGVDSIMHFLAGFVLVFLVYYFAKPYFNLKPKNKLVLLGIIALVTLGIGALYEIAELSWFLIFGVGRGGYVNNILDLLYDFLGAVMGGILVLK